MQLLKKKLQLKPDHKVLLLNAIPSLAEACAGYATTEIMAKGGHEAVLLFVKNKAELDKLAPQAIDLLKAGGLLWIVYPKMSSGIISDLSRDRGWDILVKMGFGAVRQIAFNDTWSSVRFRKKQERKTPSVFGTDAPGIDRVAKTVQVPPDLQQTLNEAGLTEVFKASAFTRRKEYVLAVLDAKRPETRAKRIQKIIETLQPDPISRLTKRGR